MNQQQYVAASTKTADDLRTVAHSALIAEVSYLTLPEIDAVVDAISRVVPAGNVPGLILNGLARLPGRHAPPDILRRDVNLLFKGVEAALDRAVYGTFFAGPAAIIWAYQNLLRLAGKDPDAAFPNGVWQFYVEYALREDTARHASETHGFDTVLDQHQISLSPVDRAAAWVMAAFTILRQQDDLLANEWRERRYLALLQEVTADRPDAAHYARLYRKWEKVRPFGRGEDASPEHDYATYRRLKFDRFVRNALRPLTPDERQRWQTAIQQAKQKELASYQQQLSLLAYLEPGPYGETRVAMPLAEAAVGIIHQGRYYLLPLIRKGKLLNVREVRGWLAMLLGQPLGQAMVRLSTLTRLERGMLAELRERFNPQLQESLLQLRQAPILLNLDQRPANVPLAEVRRGERGCGDHPLTIFDTGKTFVFDQSSIFFDAAWGAALAEIMTREALSWAVYLDRQPPPAPREPAPRPLSMPFTPTERRMIEEAPRVMVEIGAETELVALKQILQLRRILRQRNDLLRLTVNDLLVLYRIIHAFTYEPDPALVAEVEKMGRGRRTAEAAEATLGVLAGSTQNPAILIPIDASRETPRERLYPLVFEAPLSELDLVNLHGRTLDALVAYEQGSGDRSEAYAEFDRLQRVYLATIAGFGQVMDRAKAIAVAGESASVGSLKLLSHVPAPIQVLLDRIPDRFDVLNDLIKGREIFSNVGAVTRSSTLTRFITAKDDNRNKTLAWGVITDAGGTMRISLRDFRPHVDLLCKSGHRRLAQHLTRHYLETYARGLNRYVGELQKIVRASRQTRMAQLSTS